ncbi:MAG: hypothetical protein JXB10_02760 [Pirellulales bacterium]|nr:hypothetical protein [Pirellulales bacterium]
MKKHPGRPAALDKDKQDTILGVLSLGCPRRTAAGIVGCSPSTIRNTAKRNPAFAKRLRRADKSSEICWLKNITAAGKMPQYWRAAAWALEHVKPELYAKRSPQVITFKQITQLMTKFAQIVCEEIPVDKYRKAVIKRFDEIRRQLKD